LPADGTAPQSRGFFESYLAGIMLLGDNSMITVAEYRRFAAQCREMAARTSNPLDQQALELQAMAWERIANEREAAINNGDSPKTS
jgi:hypothetical protein